MSARRGCVRCGAPPIHVLYPLASVACEACAHDWYAAESCSYSTVELAVGVAETKVGWVAHMAEFEAELGRRTATWAAKGRP